MTAESLVTLCNETIHASGEVLADVDASGAVAAETAEPHDFSGNSSMSHEKYLKTKERNRIHARKSRERQKNLINSLKQDMSVLQKKFHSLQKELTQQGLMVLPNLDVERDGEINLADDKAMEIFTLHGDYSMPSCHFSNSSSFDSQQLRKERNRIHAKKTRDRKKNFIRNANNVISRLGLKIKRISSYLEANGVYCKVDEKIERIIQSVQSTTNSRQPGASKQRSKRRRMSSLDSETGSTTSEGSSTPQRRKISISQPLALTPDLTITALLLSQLKYGGYKHTFPDAVDPSFTSRHMHDQHHNRNNYVESFEFLKNTALAV